MSKKKKGFNKKSIFLGVLVFVIFLLICLLVQIYARADGTYMNVINTVGTSLLILFPYAFIGLLIAVIVRFFLK